MSKNLVAFFSASGTTKKVAEMIAEEAKADLFEELKLYLLWFISVLRSSSGVVIGAMP